MRTEREKDLLLFKALKKFKFMTSKRCTGSSSAARQNVELPRQK
jgi:hypothetical protein